MGDLFSASTLVEPLGYMAILAVSIASFLYLGFLAAGEEIEQPFGYEENDLDLDLFIREVVRADVESLLLRSCPNSYEALKSEQDERPSKGLVADAIQAQLEKENPKEGDGICNGGAKEVPAATLPGHPCIRGADNDANLSNQPPRPKATEHQDPEGARPS
ncbi:hypothetical protein FRB99_004938 [Tulasnella sp. 403]|nr:hypothetical protein FRB99_004938 [Tulasnella sp. 403]